MINSITLPQVLVVGTNPWREDGTAHTLKDIFSCWDESKLALIYTRSGLPNTNVASRFFQISEDQVFKNIWKPWRKIGKEVYNTEIVDSALTHDEEARYMKAHKKNYYLLSICREFVWLFGHWRSEALKNYIKEINPELLFITIYPTVYMGWVQRFVIKQTKKPFVCYLTDDNYSYDSCRGVLSYIHRFWLRKNVKWLSTHCKQMYVIVEKEKEEIDKLFGTNSIILTKAIDFTNRPYCSRNVNKPLRFVYTGGLLYGRDKTMTMIADAINRVNEELGETKVCFDVYSNNDPLPNVLDQLNEGACKFRGFIPRSEVDNVQKEADVVVFAEALEGKAANIARLSFSTKITDYLANGKCILAIGKENIAPIDYFHRNDSAIIAHNKQEIYQQISKIVGSPEIISEYGKKAYDCAVRNHEKKTVHGRFIENMCKVVNQ